MTTTIQTVTLISDRRFGRKVPPRALGNVLGIVSDAIRSSIRMAFEARSQAKGKHPGWLTAAADIRFLDHGGQDQTVLHFEAPRLGDAAHVMYGQKELWPTRPSPDDTGFDLLGDVIADIATNDSDSLRFDRPLLKQVARFGIGPGRSFQELSLTGTRYTENLPVKVTPIVVEAARRLSHDTPRPQATRIVGKLDMIRQSTRSFAIMLRDGQELRGVLIDAEFAKLIQLVGKDVLVLGKAVYRPSGKVLRIDAEDVFQAGERDQFFSALPKPKRRRFDLREVLKAQQHKKGIAAIFGKWPGTETDEEVMQALKELG
jgi:hypothetical protein